MPIVKPPCYRLDNIIRDGRIDAGALLNLKQDPENGLRVIQGFRKKIEDILAALNPRWITLCKGDQTELEEWNQRMNVVRSKIKEIDNEIGSGESFIFDWNLVIAEIGFLNAFREAVSTTLDYNERAPQA